ncbi:WD repeat-containing protein 34-like [Asterias rubens]|uniref:WD repeat-containing protein 34-like n=1 Tax=Asterias rubens TaxID=7604 RepID=UPI0014552E3D|nr:WD repeat-containing protein 34-like [Asterias rubens]
MFTDEVLDGVEFQSSWRRERSTKSHSSQTSEILTNDGDSQTVLKKHVKVQTDPEKEKKFELIDDKSEALTDFIKKVTPEICKMLDRNSRSHAFDGYKVNWEEDTVSVTCLRKLTHAPLKGELQCTRLAWNSTGSSLAVAYGRMDHQDWCKHKGSLCVWNVDLRRMNTEKADTVVDVNSCLMCIAYHPEKPSALVGGNFNGEVLLWDLNREDDSLIASSGIGDDSHREPVSEVMWLRDPNKPKKYNIVSVSNDGQILVWRVNARKGALELTEGFLLLASCLPATVGRAKAKGEGEMGVNSISYLSDDQSLFVIGSESGGVFKCSMTSTTPVPTTETLRSVPLHSPVIFAFQPHHGPVHSIECSPYHRNLFLTCGMDMSAQIYSMLESKSIISIEPSSGYLFSARWSPVRPLVFAVTTGEGKLLIYDLKSSRITPVQVIEASPKKSAVYSLEFNHKKPTLATGDADGIVLIWQLSDELSKQGAREIETLADVANSAMD